MTNIKQRAQELLQDKGLMIPEEVQQFMRDVVALEPDFNFRWDRRRGQYYVDRPNISGCAVYALEGVKHVNDPA